MNNTGKSSALKGFITIFKYTVKNSMMNTKYILTTTIIGLLIIAGISVGMYFISKPDKVMDSIEEVHIFNETDLKLPAYGQLAKMSDDEEIAAINFIKEEGNVKDYVEKLQDSENDEAMSELVLVAQKYGEDGYFIEILTNANTKYSEDSLNHLKDSLVKYYKMFILTTSGLNNDELERAVLPVISTYSAFGEEENEYKVIVQIVVLFSILIVVYMLVILYGQQICRDVSLEKSSKLMETLLVTVRPLSLVSGKILGNIFACIVQFIVWIAAIFVGVWGSSQFFTRKFELEENLVAVIWGYLGDWFDNAGFGATQIILCIIIAILGIVLYMLLAGLAGSMVSKPEEAANMQTVFMLPMMLSYFAAIFALVEGEGHVDTIFHIIPFTSALVTPGAVLTGDVSITIALIALAINIVCGVIIMYAAGRIYKGMAFYNGQKISAKTIFSMIFGKM